MKKRVLSFSLVFLLMLSVLPAGLTFNAMAESPQTVVLPLAEREVYYGAKEAEEESQYISASKYGSIDPFESAVYNAAVKSVAQTDISALGYTYNNALELSSLIQKYIDKYPELYNIEKFGFSYSSETKKIVKLNLTFSYSAQQYALMNAQYKAVAARLVKDLSSNPSLTDVEKALLLHDRIAELCEYDYDNYMDFVNGEGEVPNDSYNMYGALVKGVAVCQGYSKSYQYMLNLLGIENYLCSSNELNHVWNIIKVDGEFYHVDVTWDDPVYDVNGRVQHDNFLRSSEGIFESGHKEDNDTDLSDIDYDTTPTATKYDEYFWQKSETAFQLLDGEIYYIAQEASGIGRTVGKIYQCDGALDGNGEELYVISSVWRTGASSSYSQNFSRLSSDGDSLYFSTNDTVYQFDTENDSVHSIYVPDTESYDYFSIYGFTIRDGYIYCDLYDSANFESDTKADYGIKVPYGAKPTFNLNHTEYNVAPGDELYLEIADFNANGSTATVNDAVWSSSDEDIATVDTVGKVTVRSTGVVYIYCNIQKASVSCRIVSVLPGNVSFNAQTITVSPITDSYVYSGEAYKPSVTLNYNDVELTEGVDYTVIYSKNINAGTAKVTFTGTNNPYVGSFSVEFNIEPLDITAPLTNALEIYAVNCYYNGSQKTVNFQINNGNYILQSGTDYDVSYKNNVKVGVATVTATGKGNYKGSYSKNFTIKPLYITNAKVTNITDKAYTGAAISVYPIITYSGKTLVKNVDYSLKYSSNIYTGKATVTVTGIGNFYGSKAYYFYIHPAKVTGVKMTAGGGTYVKLKWTKAKSGTGYAVLRATSKTGTYKTVALLSSLSKYYYTDKDLSKGKTYYYKIVAYKTVSGVKFTSVSSSILTAKTATKAPTITYYKNLSGKKAKVKCAKVSGASGYRIYMSTKKSSGYKMIYSGSKYYYTKSKLTRGKTYYFKIRTYRTTNGIKVYSSYSLYKKIKITK